MKNQSPYTQLGSFLLCWTLPITRIRRPGLLLAVSALVVSTVFATVALAQPNPSAFLTFTELNPGQQDVHFGASILVSDFNCDGIDDMVIGAPRRDITVESTLIVDAGWIEVYRGVEGGGLNSAAALSQDSIGRLAESGDQFGGVLVTGNFNGDSVDGRPCMDLAIGNPFEDISGESNAGAVFVIFGKPGTTSSFLFQDNFTQAWHQNQIEVLGSAEAFDNFGNALAAGDFDGDGFDDLAIASARESLGEVGTAGQINVLAGDSTGLITRAGTSWTSVIHRGLFDVEGIPEISDLLGASLTSCDIDGDLKDDLVVGVPGQDGTTQDNLGAIQTFFGSSTIGLDFDRQSTEQYRIATWPARLGESMVGGEFDPERAGCEIAVSARFDLDQGGRVALYKPHPNVVNSMYDSFTENSFPDEVLAADEFFGTSLATIDSNADGIDELLIGAPFESTTATWDGALFWMPFDGRTPESYRAPQAFADSVNSLEQLRFGGVMAAIDIGQDDVTALALGFPQWPDIDSNGLQSGAGLVMIIAVNGKPLFADSFESGSTSAWE